MVITIILIIDRKRDVKIIAVNTFELIISYFKRK
jgi:hypothetical protein